MNRQPNLCDESAWSASVVLPPDSSKKARRPGQKWRCSTRTGLFVFLATVGALWWHSRPVHQPVAADSSTLGNKKHEIALQDAAERESDSEGWRLYRVATLESLLAAEQARTAEAVAASAELTKQLDEMRQRLDKAEHLVIDTKLQLDDANQRVQEMLASGDAQNEVRSVSEPHLPNHTLPYLLSLDPTTRAKLLMNGRAYLLEGLLDGWQLHTTKSSFMKRYGGYPIHDSRK